VKPEKYGPAPEAFTPLVAPAAEDSVKGYGFLTAIQPVTAPRRPAQAGRGEPALPPLRGKAADKGTKRREDAPGATDESDKLPLPRSRRGGDDEDLLP
jgi:hypothetical protein